MRAGLLKYAVTFAEPTLKETEFSGKVTDYVDAFTTRANVYHNRGNKVIDSGEIFTSYTLTFEIRNFHKVKSDMIIKHDGSRYRILDINPEEEKQRISIIAEVINE